MLLLINSLFGSVIKVLLLDDFIKLRLILQHFDFILWLTLILKMWDVCLCIGVYLTRNAISFLFQAGALQTWLWYIRCTFHSSFSYSQCANNLGVKTSSFTGTTQRRHLRLWTWSQTQNLWDYCFNRKPQSCLILFRPKIHLIKKSYSWVFLLFFTIEGMQTATFCGTSGLNIGMWQLGRAMISGSLKLQWTFCRINLKPSVLEGVWKGTEMQMEVV